MQDGTTLRQARTEDTAAIAAIWYEGWQIAHLGNVPDELLRVRSRASFDTRAAQRVPQTTVAIVADAVAGFVMVVGDEVEQVYVAAQHRGTGLAAPLLAAAEQRVHAGGHREAWLAVVAGNTRARKFYETHGWTDKGLFTHHAPGPDGPIEVPAHRYVKAVAP
ncbi:GNAT family N-acetyltransferase [Nocardia brasiliensis]|uniref:GNAT family N-acetyltransferase n=1 Tax=Nocardia brasiliensis TaxID=37326 RepID=UPI00245672D4|nr:GNAT family N-acetyltransferase [Nocardia brasiliensis]